MVRVRSFDPLLWRIQVEAGLTTSELRRIVRESGLVFPPDPGAAEQSQIGGNIATNAGGPHAFKYGVTGAWVTGLEAVVPPGELISVGGAMRKDVAGYDLKSLLIGSEGTLGIVTAAWLRLIPAPEAAIPVAAVYPDVSSGCRALESVLGNGLQVAALEYLDGRTIEVATGSYPGEIPAGTGFMVLAEADGRAAEAAAMADELAEVLAEEALDVFRFDDADQIAALWRWRDGVSIAVTALLGGKLSEDVVVPIDRLAEAVEGTLEIGARHGLDACSWGHAGDGNLHSSFMLDRGDTAAIERAARACDELFALAANLGGSISRRFLRPGVRAQLELVLGGGGQDGEHEPAFLGGERDKVGGGGSGSTPPGWTAIAMSAFSAAAVAASRRGRRSALIAGLSSDGPTRRGGVPT